MAKKGNNIVVNGEHGKGRRLPLFNGTSAVLYPGTVMQLDTSVALRAGVSTAVVYNRDADGNRPAGPYIVATEEYGRLAGRTIDDTIADGEQFGGYVPLPGDDLNLMVADADTGTSTNDVAVGTLMIVDDGTGYLIATTGSPESEVALMMDAANNLSGAALNWVQWTGY